MMSAICEPKMPTHKAAAERMSIGTYMRADSVTAGAFASSHRCLFHSGRVFMFCLFNSASLSCDGDSVVVAVLRAGSSVRL